VGECLGNLLSFCNIIHQCGDNSVFNDFEVLTNLKSRLGDTVGKYYLRKFVFEDEIGEAFAKSNVVVSRSGAHTTGELLALKKLCLLIPIPWVSHNEQYENAKILVDAELGSILPEAKLFSQSLTDGVKTMLNKIINIRSLRFARDDNSTIRNDITEPAELVVQQLLLIIKET